MKKYLLFVSGLLLSSPLVLAQNAPDPAKPADPAVPATPADPGTEPATPATPAIPAEPSKDGKKKPDAKKPKASGETATDSERGGKAKGKADFAAFDANGDGSLSKDEVKGDSGIRFKDVDRDGNGSLSRAEYESSIKAKPPNEPEQPKQ